MWGWKVFFFSLCVCTLSAARGLDFLDYPTCHGDVALDELCSIRVADVSPGQPSVGRREVIQIKKEIARIREKKKAKVRLREYIIEHAGSLALGPQKTVVLLNSNHHFTGYWESGIPVGLARPFVDRRDMKSVEAFYEWLADQKLLYLFDNKGRGPLHPSQLPRHMGELKNDPFRSLAKEVIRQMKLPRPKMFYREFYLGNFLRKHVKMENEQRDFDTAVKSSLQLLSRPDVHTLKGAESCAAFFVEHAS